VTATTALTPFPIPIAVEVPAALAAEAEGKTVAVARILAWFKVRLGQLGLPGEPQLVFRAGDPTRTVRVFVHERLQPFSPQLMERVWLAVVRDGTDALRKRGSPSPDGFPDGWFRSLIDNLPTSNTEAADRDASVRFAAHLAVEVAMDRPVCLLGPNQLKSFAKEVLNVGSGPVRMLRRVLEGLLRMGLMATPAAVSAALAEAARHGTKAPDLVEGLAADLRPNRVEIQVSSDEFQVLFPGEKGLGPVSVYSDSFPPSEREAFERMEQELFEALGVRPPAMFLLPVEDVSSGTLRLKVNNLVSPPMPYGSSVAGAVGVELRRQASRLLGIEDVETQLDLLDEIFPQLVSATLEHVSLGDLTRILRGLLEEGVSIRDLRAILERLVQFDTIPVDLEKYIAFDDRLPVSPEGPIPAARAYLAFVRSGSGLRNWLTHQFRDSGLVAGRVRVIKLDESLEQRLCRIAEGGSRPRDDPAWDETQNAILAWLWREMSGLPEGVRRPVLLVRNPLTRRLVRDLVAGEQHELPVVVRSELRPDVELISGTV
jgi:hypothetical protein